ncbi:MAG TPA: glycoside hydrolase family 9 protein [Bacillota bacterium]|nr:glycoside hydrolase family 9 protein [Bacillota bacterium]
MRKIHGLIIGLALVGTSLLAVPRLFAQTDFNYADAFAKSILYYEASWCGPDAGKNRLPWRDACHIEDGKDVGLDLTGGFHDAGDHVKFGLPQVYAASTLGWAYYEFKDTFVEKGQDGYMRNILKHFSDYFLKCYPNNTTFYYQCGDGTTDHSYWGPPELQTTAVTTRPTLYAATPATPASDVCGSAAASLALTYLNFKDQDETYAEKCLTAAKNLFDFAKKYRGKSESGGFYGSTSDIDDLSWGAIWLYVATNDEAYLTDINNLMLEKGIDGKNGYCNHWTHCWDDVFGGVFVKLAQLTNDPKYITIADENLNYWMTQAPKTPGGVKYINSWGALRYTAAECMMAVVYYKTTGKTEYLNFAKEQIDYILGKNPRNSSYVVGFGNNYPKFPHHRAASGRMEAAPAYETKKDPEKHLLYGALVGGPDSDDNYSDAVDEYVYTEVAIDYNAGFVGAMAGITKYYGAGQKPEATPGIEGDTPELYSEAKVMEESNQHITVDAFIHCDTMLPPRYVKGMTFRYFVDLSEYYAAGLTANDVSTAINYAPNGGVISKLIPWDEARHIYYIEGSWPNSENFGKIEFQFRIAAYNAKVWDSGNDFSYQGLTKAFAVTDNIPVYVDGVKVFGNEPSGTIPPTVTPSPTQTLEPTSTVAPTPTITSGPSPSPTLEPSPSVIPDGCTISYRAQNDWGNGSTVTVTIKNNGTSPVNGWTIVWNFAGNQKITNLWNGSHTQTGTTVTVKNAAYNATIPANGTVSFGFNISYSGTNIAPASFTLNGSPCGTTE